METTVPFQDTLAADLIDEIERIVLAADDESQPLELEPHRGKLFELFVTAEGAGYLDEEADLDFSADSICKLLAERWGLAAEAQRSFESQNKMSNDHLAKMRLLWSVMRMWMEWTYAWSRWSEFHKSGDES